MDIQTYIQTVNTRYKAGNTTEHSFRGDLQQLLETLLPGILATNEPTRIACGAPDYILTKNDIPICYIEAKDLGADLNSKSHQAQFKRYRDALNNLIITNYLDFQVYKDGELITSYTIGEIIKSKVVAKPDSFGAFVSQINDFALPVGLPIKSALKLAGMMAIKAKMLAEVINEALNSDELSADNSTLTDQYNSFKAILIHDITAKGFADIYAQTIAYGMFAARLHDPTLATFSRQEAAELIPKTNPFLRKLFQYVAGYDLDKRIVWIVDALADVFRATDVKAILTNFGKPTQQNDPIIHFYETFLSEYDPALRKARGVWYTPEPVVKFIVRAVDDILKTEFKLPDGLADTSKTKIKVKVPTHDKRYTAGLRDYEQEVHKVQILDPATGTGTFLAEVIKYIYSERFEGQQGMWSNYVENHLIPRINGFELLMASYAMAHLKLELLLTETGYKPTKDQRLKVYLTNSLEESHPDTGTLFANWLSSEANEASQIKRDTPVMVIIGNPPYSGESANKGDWIMKLMEDYKKEPGGKEKLKERNPKWINDDYVKFLRYGQHFIEKNGSGVLAYINSHGFLDNPTFRGMRWNLLKTFDKIYVLDLHGNSKKKEISPDGSGDINVFDIMQGVSINLLLKTGRKKDAELGKVFHFDLLGKREMKYQFLSNNYLSSILFSALEPVAPNYFFVQKDFSQKEKYENGFLLNQMFLINSVGIVTANDLALINEKKESLIISVKKEYNAKIDESQIRKVFYRPFDNKLVYYDPKIIERARSKVMRNFFIDNNNGLVVGRQGQVVGSMAWNLCFISNGITDFNLFYRGGGVLFPLYLDGDLTELNFSKEPIRKPNLNLEIVGKISGLLGLRFCHEKENNIGEFAPIDVLDYIYAILHSPAYRERYKEFLKIDFPRIPYPKDAATFWALVQKGGEIRQLHLLESPLLSKRITKYPIDGSNEVTKPVYKDGKVYINDTQYFEGVPQVAWEFYIGGYQPAQKWLKDRKERVLTYEDITHYQRVIIALTETARIMQEIDTIDFM